MGFRAILREFLLVTICVHVYNEMMVVHMRVHSKELLENGATQMHEVVRKHTVRTLVVGWTPKHVADGLEERCDILVRRHLLSHGFCTCTGVGLEPLKSVQK